MGEGCHLDPPEWRVTTVTVLTMKCRGSLKRMAPPSRELGGGVIGREHKSDKARRRCEVRTLYSSPNTSSATLIDGARHPVWVMSSRYFERASIIRWQAFVQELLRCSFLHAILKLQSETRHPQSPLATILPRSGRSPRSAPRW
jgi:hypothetical protein